MITNENILSLLLSKIVKIEDREENGKKWSSRKFCKTNGLRYRFVLDEYIDDFILTLLSKWDSQSNGNALGIR